MSREGSLDRAALAAAAITALGWGLTGAVIRMLPPISPVSVTAARLLLAAIVTLPLVPLLFAGNTDIWRVWRQPAAYALAGLLAGYYLLATAAFQLAPVAEAALLLSTPPLYVVLWHRCSGRRSARVEAVGAVTALSGLVLLLAPQWSLAGPDLTDRISGDVLALLASLLVAVYALYFRSMAADARQPHAGGLTLMTFALGAVVLAAVHMTMDAAPLRGFGAAELPLWAVLGVVCTALPSAGYAFASRRLPAVITTSVSLLLPLLAALFAYLLLGESVPPSALPGAALVLTGIGLILRRSAPR